MKRNLRVTGLLSVALCFWIGSAEAEENEGKSGLFDVMLLVDGSGTTADYSRDSARVVIDAMGDAHRLGIVVFGESAEVVFPIQRISTLEKKTQAESAFNAFALDAKESNLESGLIATLEHMGKNVRPGAKKIVVLITDGRVGGSKHSKEQIARIKSEVLPAYLTEKVVLHVVALKDADLDLLQICANITGGKSLAAPTLGTMTDALDTLVERLKPPEQIVVPKVMAGGTLPQSVDGDKDGVASKTPSLKGSSGMVLAVGAIVVVAVALIVVTIVLLLQVLLHVKPKKTEERAESSLKVRKEGGFAGLRDVSNNLHNLLVDAGELSEHLNLDLEDFGVEGWKKQKALREKYGDLARGVFLLIDHLKIGVDGSGTLDIKWLRDKLERILEDENIEEMTVAPGVEFDGRYHVHVGEETSSLPPGSVIEVKRTGYVQSVKEKDAEPVVLRRAEVVVVRGKPQKREEAQDGGKK